MTTPTAPDPLPRVASFEKLGYGLFLHWGLYSQMGRGEWIQHQAPIPPHEYRRLADTFTAKDFDADAWCRLAAEAGMRYVCFTTRHHDGFSLYDTRGLNDYDASHSPAGRDLVREMVESCRQHGLLPMLYHTTLDWHWSDTSTCDLPDQDAMDQYLQYLNRSVELLCTHYGTIGGLWFDGNWSRPDLDWRVDDLYATIRQHQPEAIIVNNTGLSDLGVFGHREVDSVTYEQGTPQPRDQRGQTKYVAAEMCQTMNQHWGIGSNDFNYKSPADVIKTLCRCRRAGANLLLNVGPTAQGGIPEYEAAVLRRTGAWLRDAGELIYAGQPVPHLVCSGEDFVLANGGDLYYVAFNLHRGGDANVTVDGGVRGPRSIKGLIDHIEAVSWIDQGDPLNFTQSPDRTLLSFDATGYPYGSDRVVRIARLQR